MIDRKQLGLRIREARLHMGMSQQELAGSIGVSDKTISAYEVGRVDPPLDALEKLSQATEHPVAFFIGDMQSNIGSKLDRIAEELVQIREALKADQRTVTPNVQMPTVDQTSLSEDQSVL